MSKNNKKNNKKKKSKGKIALSIVSVLLLIVVVAAINYEAILSIFGINANFADQTQGNEKYTMLSVKENLYNNINSDVLLGDTNYINILLFGLDENEERQDEYVTFRPDTIMLISVNFDTKQISILSIPRDTYVPIYSRSGKDKINSCFYYGLFSDYSNSDELFLNGVEILKGTVSNILGGVPIHYYVGVNMDTAADIIDAMGGVYFNLEHDVYLYDEVFYNAVEKVWDGDEFINLARLRGYANGDITRTAMQQKLLKALFDAVKQIKLTKIPGVIKLAYKSLKTDINMKTAVSFVLAALEIDTSNIKTATMPGFFGAYYNHSYWVINQTERIALIRDLYGISASYMEQDPTLKILHLYEDIDGKTYRYYVNVNSRKVYVDDEGNEWFSADLDKYVHAENIEPPPNTGEETNGSTDPPESGGTETPEENTDPVTPEPEPDPTGGEVSE